MLFLPCFLCQSSLGKYVQGFPGYPFQKLIFTENELKKWTLKSQKSQIAILLLNQCSISAVFPIVRFAGDQKTALTGESLYIIIHNICTVISFDFWLILYPSLGNLKAHITLLSALQSFFQRNRCHFGLHL